MSSVAEVVVSRDCSVVGPCTHSSVQFFPGFKGTLRTLSQMSSHADAKGIVDFFWRNIKVIFLERQRTCTLLGAGLTQVIFPAFSSLYRVRQKGVGSCEKDNIENDVWQDRRPTDPGAARVR